jgi:hypothetical protein
MNIADIEQVTEHAIYIVHRYNFTNPLIKRKTTKHKNKNKNKNKKLNYNRPKLFFTLITLSK